MTPSQRLQAALQSDSPAQAVLALARMLRDEGMPQVALYRLYLDALQRHNEKASDNDTLYDALGDTMDLIWGGGWAKGHALFDQALTQARLEQE